MTTINEILKIFVLSAVLAIPVSLIDYMILKKIVFEITDFLHYQSPKKIILDENGAPYIYYK